MVSRIGGATKGRSLGDCSATKYAPTAQVASQQGTYLARLFNTMATRYALETEIKELEEQSQGADIRETVKDRTKQLSKVKNIKPFEYSHQGMSVRGEAED
jgi:NADH:quinone reductase (non-electrogenic)